MTKYETRPLNWFAGLGLAILAWPALATTTALEKQSFLHPEQRHENIGELVTQFVQKSHYNHVAVDDALSSEVLDLYIESLDRNRMLLLQGDIEYFDSYRYELDDIVKSKPLDPVFEMYEVYQTRMRERLEYALSLLETEPDYSIDESYQFDRSEQPWAKSSAELDEIWRKRVKNDALNLALEEEPWEKIQEVLTKRYKGY
ncbi:MAG: tail-specific protease, partial [Gammaproteobacteria bacterium]|nr:tail-specific protease [Gammaproteobacteria bacterium]